MTCFEEKIIYVPLGALARAIAANAIKRDGKV